MRVGGGSVAVCLATHWLADSSARRPFRGIRQSAPARPRRDSPASLEAVLLSGQSCALVSPLAVEEPVQPDDQMYSTLYNDDADKRLSKDMTRES